MKIGLEMGSNLAMESRAESQSAQPAYRDFRPGDVRHSLADISKPRKLLSYDPKFSVSQGLELAAQWYTKAFV